MKATVVVNSMTIDILFLWGDEVFAKHIHKVAVESGFTKESFQGLDSIDLSSIAHIFSPMIASFSHMNDLGNPYQSVTCQDGTLFVFRQFDNLTFFAISNSGEESEEFLQRKLSVVHNLAVMYFGASLEMLKPEVRSARNRIWKSLGSLIDTWEELCSQQQSFLVEAVERISVNQSLSEMAVSLLDSALSVSKNKGDQNTMHTLLLVNSKLLALYSSRNASELQAADILMITLFAQSVFPHTSAVIPYSSNRTPPPLAYQTVCKGSPSSIDQIITNTSNGTPHVSNSSRLRWPASKPITISKSSQEAAESLNSSLEDTFYSPPSTPSTEELSTPSSLEAITQASGVLQEEYFSPRAHTPEHKDSQNHRKQSLPEEEHSDSSSQDSVPPPAANVQEYYRQPGFLHASNCPYIPHILHFVYIAEGTVLVLVSEVQYLSVFYV